MANAKKPQDRAVVRVVIQASRSDAGLVRELAAELRKGRRAAELRRRIRRVLRPPTSLRELLLMEVAIPDEVVDEAFARSRDMGRGVDLT